jgi:hypothetical protein
MKDIYTLYESLLAGQDKTLQAGEAITSVIKEFDDISKLTSKQFINGEYMWTCPAFLNYCGIANYSIIKFNIEYWEDDDNGQMIECEMRLFNDKTSLCSNDIDFVTVPKEFKNKAIALNALVKNIKHVFNFNNIEYLKNQIIKRIK